jgi:hypothetical protein
VKIDGHVEASAAQPAGHGEIVAQAGKAGSLRGNDDLVQQRVTDNDRGGRRLDEVRQMRVRESVSEGPNGRRRKRDVA